MKLWLSSSPIYNAITLDNGKKHNMISTYMREKTPKSVQIKPNLFWWLFCQRNLLATGAHASLRVTLFGYILFTPLFNQNRFVPPILSIKASVSYQKIVYHFYVPMAICNAFCLLSFNDHISFLFSLNVGENFVSPYSYLNKYF